MQESWNIWDPNVVRVEGGYSFNLMWLITKEGADDIKWGSFGQL
jgi:peptidase E